MIAVSGQHLTNSKPHLPHEESVGLFVIWVETHVHPGSSMPTGDGAEQRVTVFHWLLQGTAEPVGPGTEKQSSHVDSQGLQTEAAT